EIMAIVNSTPDSFYEGSRFLHNMKGLTEILDQKPDIIDIGGESTRPGSTEVHYEEEIKRLKPLIEYISGSCDIPISLDTRHPEVLEKFVSEVDIINDISGFRSDRMISIAAENDLECVLMHMKGTPENMNQFTSYSNIFLEISEFFMERINQMLEKGVRKGNIILDPGIGFSKTYQQNLQLLKNIRRFDFGLRTLVGASRKSFIGRITGEKPEGRLSGSLAAAVWCSINGVSIVRTHDPGETRKALDVVSAIRGI
ncbi:MAG: dihydropteroate synthase, partial [Candidatus Thermoplasmatota archaeon]|nr:dihydropteroate synthase [Candidatus Thermoplasmatota archaeon]